MPGLQVHLVTPEREVWTGEAGFVVARAVDGGFLHVAHEDDTTRVDILAEHAVLADELGGEDLSEFERRAEELRDEGQYDEARTEEAKATTRRRLGSS